MKNACFLQGKRLLLVLASCTTLLLSVQSQPISPTLWYRADIGYQDTTGWDTYRDTISVKFDGTLPSTGLMNFNPAITLSDSFNGFYNALDTMFDAATVYIVYQTDGSLEENFLWNLHLATGKNLQLSTRRLTQVRSEIAYSDSGMVGPLISASYLGWKHIDMDSTGVSIRFGGRDTLFCNGLVSEFIYFPSKLEKMQDQIIQSYLAIKYGVTLYDASYVNASGDTIWDVAMAHGYDKQIAALGRDTLLDVYQKQSKSHQDIIVLAAGDIATTNESNPSQLEQDNFIFLSNDGKGLQPQLAPFLSDTNVNSIIKQAWMVRPSGDDARSIGTSLCIDVSQMQTSDPDHCILLLDTSGVGSFAIPGIMYVYPDSVVADSLAYFSNLFWDTDSNGFDVFTLAVKKPDETKDQIVQEWIDLYSDDGLNQQGESLTMLSDETTYCLFPNPTTGNYTLEVTLAEESKLSIEVFDNSGKLFDQYSSETGKHHRFIRSMHTPGIYQIRISSKDQVESLHLIVR